MLGRLIGAIEKSPVLFHLTNLLVASVWVYKAVGAYDRCRRSLDVPGATWIEKAQAASNVLLLVNLVLLVIFFVFRRRARDVAVDMSSVIWAHVGTWITLAFHAFTRFEDLPPWYADVAKPCIAVMSLSVAGSTLGFISLGRSWGIIPANRGVRTGGLYRIVRHPIYANYIVFDIAWTALETDAWNVAVCLGAIVALYVRTRQEEVVLMRDPAYAEYAKRTRYKLLPFLV